MTGLPPARLRASRPRWSDLVDVRLDASVREPLHRQLYRQVRDAILDGRARPGSRLPGYRPLAAELGCSRITTANAYELLKAEGYVEGRSGSGTYVAQVTPDRPLPASLAGDEGPPAAPASIALSARGAALEAGVPGWATQGSGLLPGTPAADEFPFEIWTRLFARHWRAPSRALLRNADPAGLPALRASIAEYLLDARGLRCTPEQVVVTSGSTNAMDLVARLLLDPGDTVWIEDPGWRGVEGTFGAAGLRCVRVPVDAEGLSVAAGLAAAPEARLALVTPSHQYPLGVVMSARRRLELVRWARARGAIVLEDDFDAEFRYAGRPLSTLYALDAGARVVYAGTFSKICFLGLRLGYLVLPGDLAPRFARARLDLDFQTALPLQAAMADFLREGHLAAHVRRMRRRYAQRQQVLRSAVDRHLGDLLEIGPHEAGLHVVARLAPALARRASDEQVAAAAEAGGVPVAPLRHFCAGVPPFAALVLGYAGVPERELDERVGRLARALRPLLD